MPSTEELKGLLLAPYKKEAQVPDPESDSDKATYFIQKAIEDLQSARSHCVLANCKLTADSLKGVIGLLTERTSEGASLLEALEIEARMEYEDRTL